MIEASAGMISAGEPEPVDPMAEGEMQAIDEEKLESLGMSLSARRDQWIAARKASGVEKRWMEDLDQYHGRDASTKQASSMMEAAEQGYPVSNKEAKAQRSTVYVNITRPKTNAAEARLANMVFPSDDRNFGLIPNHNPELTKAAMAEAKAASVQAAQAATPMTPAGAPGSGAPPAAQTSPNAAPGITPPAAPQPPNLPGAYPGAPPQISAPGMPSPGQTPAPPTGTIAGQVTPEMTATAQLETATRRSKAMQDEIDRQLIACQYNGEGRKCLHDSAVVGTGIMKGPIVVNRVRKSWSPMKDSTDPSVFVLETVKERDPAAECVSPWNVFPDPSCGADIHNGRGLFEYRTVTSKQLRDLSKQPGYLPEQIGKVLEEGPADTPYVSENNQRERDDNATKPHDSEHFQLWEYWGEFSPEDLRTAGVDMPDSSTDSISGCLIIVNKTVIKGFLNPIETGDLPYDFMPWEMVDGSPWGYGVPFLMRPAQRVLNAAWRQLMDNSGLSVGPQVFIKARGVDPADGRRELTGRKIWMCDDTVNPRDAMAMVDIPNHGKEIQQIIDMAMKFSDLESSVPALNQGEKQNAPDTVGGMTILMNSSNVVLGRLVKQFDDCITRPLIGRFFDWNMAYSDLAEIKGDFQVDARGSSSLLLRDTHATALLALGQYQGSGIISPLIDWSGWFRAILKMQQIDPTDIMKTEAEIAQIQDAPPSATPEQVKSEAQIQIAQIKAAAMQQTAQAKIAGEEEYARTLQEMSAGNAASRRQETQDKIQLEIARLASTEKTSIEEIKSQLARTSMIERSKRELAAAELQLRQNEKHGDRQHQLDVATHQAALNAANQSPSGS